MEAQHRNSRRVGPVEFWGSQGMPRVCQGYAKGVKNGMKMDEASMLDQLPVFSSLLSFAQWGFYNQWFSVDSSPLLEAKSTTRVNSHCGKFEV